MINQLTIKPPAGVNFIYDAALKFVKMIFVSVETLQYDIDDHTENRMGDYEPSEGRIYFDNEFNGLQRVLVIFKTDSTGI